MRLRDLVIWGIEQVGLATLARHVLVSKGRFALIFHGVSSQRYTVIPNELQPHHSAAEFHQVLAWLSRYFAFLSVEEFLYDVKPGVLLTFDDGHANNLKNILPILTEFRAQGLFFVATQHVQSPRNWLSFTKKQLQHSWGTEIAIPDDFARDCYDGLSEAQLAELGSSPWAVIGAHTVSHPSLPTCSREQLRIELTESRSYLQKISGQLVEYFAYPFGYYNRTVAKAVKDVGYQAAFAVDPLPVGLNSYEIPRVGIYAASSSYMSVKLSGLYRSPLRGPALNRKIHK